MPPSLRRFSDQPGADSPNPFHVGRQLWRIEKKIHETLLIIDGKPESASAIGSQDNDLRSSAVDERVVGLTQFSQMEPVTLDSMTLCVSYPLSRTIGMSARTSRRWCFTSTRRRSGIARSAQRASAVTAISASVRLARRGRAKLL
jgi:hypothetical protein